MAGERGSWRALFPPDAPPVAAARDTALSGLVVVVGLLVPLARQAGVGVLDTVWAEDGRVFLQEALALGPAEALSRTYAGYLHLGPRLAAELATLFPVDAASEALVLAANALTALSALAVFVASRSHLRSPWVRTLLALAVPLASSAGVEVLNSVANSQWPLLFASFWLLLWRPATPTGVIASSLLLVLAALSAGLGILLLPLAVLRLFTEPFARDQLPAWLFCSAVAVQLAAIQAPAPHAGSDPSTVVAAFAQRVGIVALGGHRVGGTLWARGGLGIMAAAAVLLVAIVAVGVLLRGSRTRWLVVVCACYAVLFFAAGTSLRGVASGLVWPRGGWHEVGGRYTYVPVLLVYSLFAAVLDARTVDVRGLRGVPRDVAQLLLTGARVATLAVVLVANAGDFRLWNDRTPGPRWGESLRQARVACVRDGEEVVIVPIVPPNWTVTVPCREMHDEEG
ncbi:MAG: hypothetical protein ABR592_12600 [Nitriliruptorales bacterium]